VNFATVQNKKKAPEGNGGIIIVGSGLLLFPIGLFMGPPIVC
jgi:hypothetical protein